MESVTAERDQTIVQLQAEIDQKDQELQVSQMKEEQNDVLDQALEQIKNMSQVNIALNTQIEE